MAATETIALKITLNGVDVIIDSVEKLEQVIGQLKTELSQISDKSSAGFSALSGVVESFEQQLSQVKSEANQTGTAIENAADKGSEAMKELGQKTDETGNKIENLDKKTKSVSFEKAFQAFAKVGSAVTSGFAAATAAVGLFGGDSTKIAEAATKAQQGLTLAIAAREFAEAAGALVTVKATIVQKAKNIADTASIGIIRKLFALIAAHPYTALAVAIGAVVVALYSLISAQSEEEKQAKKTAEAYARGNEQIKQTLANADLLGERYQNLVAATNKGTISVEAFQEALNNLIPSAKEAFAALSGKELLEFLDNAIKLQSLEAQMKTFIETLNSDELKTDPKAQKEMIAKIKEFDIYIAKRQATQEYYRNLIAKRKQDEIDAERKAQENEKKAAEARQKALLEEIKLRSELVMLGYEQYEARQKLDSPEVQFQTEQQLDNLRELTKQTDEYLTVTQKLAKLTADYSESDMKRIQDAEDTITGFGLKIQNLDKILSMAFKEAKVQVQAVDLRKLLNEQFEIENGVAVDLKTQFQNTANLINFQRKFIQEYTDERLKSSKNTGEALRAEEEAYRAEAKALFDTLVQNEQALIQYQAKVKQLKDELAKLSAETNNLKQSQALLNGFIRANATDITKQYSIKLGDLETNRAKALELQKQFDTKNFDSQKNFASDITQLEAQLKSQGFDIANAGYEEKLQLLKLFLDKEVKAVEEGEAKKQETQKATFSKYEEIIQNFQSVLNSLQQTSTMFFNAQFDTLEKRYKRITEGIIGDTEAANKKRIEAEKAYNNERARLEKQAAKATLRISLAQALANTAGAIIKVSEQTGVFAPIAAGVIAALNAAQVGIIANQLANIDSYKRGGILKKQGGGLVTGPSHEYGGVKFQGGGIELEGNEAIISRTATVNYMGLLNQINQSGGGKPVYPNFDDSRIVEAIAKQRNTPIRAYVVESDITTSQETAKRLQKLSEF